MSDQKIPAGPRALIPGFATDAGTRTFQRRHAEQAAHGHFRELRAPAPVSTPAPAGGSEASAQVSLALSSIGIGTYLGRDDDATDQLYTEAVLSALERGINVIDTAINYRNQRSERAIGEALRRAILHDGWIAREELVVSTKGGFLPFDGHRPANARAHFEENYLRPGIFRWEDVVGGCHCMTPRYLRDQLARSRRNLGLATIDIYYLHNLEMQLDEVPRPEFLRRVRAAFEALEEARRANELRFYGTATWNGYRAPVSEPGRLELDELLALAREVGGEAHGFRVIQLPYNLGMREASTTKNQRGQRQSILEAAAESGVYVMTSGSIGQGKLARTLVDAVQFARSARGVGTALVGMKNTAHVAENSAVAKLSPLAS